MRLRALLFAALLLAGLPAEAARVAEFHCTPTGTRAVCEIQLEGEVGEYESLFLSRVYDRDRLLFRGQEIGSTGTLFGRAFQASLLPRLYSLRALHGQNSPTLTLEADSELFHRPGIPHAAQVAVVSANFPLWKLLGPVFFSCLVFGFFTALAGYLLWWQHRRAPDGWIFPNDEMRWFLGSLSVYALLRHEVAQCLVPLVWSPHAHLFAQRLALSVALWALTSLLLHGRFSDRSCIERSRPRRSAKGFSRLADLTLLGALFTLAQFPQLSGRGATWITLALLVPLALAFGRAVQEMEWQRVWKRSSTAPLAFYLSLLCVPASAAACLFHAWVRGNNLQTPLQWAAYATLLAAGWRLQSAWRTRDRSRELARECREILVRHPQGSDRLQALCDFVAGEWGAARVTVLSVEQDIGLVLASAGPEAIPSAQSAEPRRLGPFLRRVCKQRHMLYAPVAEELGQDLQNEGLKHSSLAIPLHQEKSVHAVVCMMADEGERIPPGDAAQLELLVEALSLEVLSAVAQQVSEGRHEHLLTIARESNALAVERLGPWGHSLPAPERETRVVLGGDSLPAGPFLEQLKRSPLFAKVWLAYRGELRALWTALAAAFEFLPKDNREDFWVVSPREFQNPHLRALGPERVALLLGAALERHARALAARECYRALGYTGVRLVSQNLPLRAAPWHGSAVEVCGESFSGLLDQRARTTPGQFVFRGTVASLAHEGFTLRARPLEGESQEIFSILGASADKKEMRRLENLALEKARAHSRKAG